MNLFLSLYHCSGVARGGANGVLVPPFSRENATHVLCTMIKYSQNKLATSYFSLDSNDFDKAGYKADILSTYFHDADRLNASEVGQS